MDCETVKPEAVPSEQADLEAAIARCKPLVTAIDANKMTVGAEAARLETTYRGKVVAKFADGLGLDPESVRRYRSVAVAYEGVTFGETSPSFGAMAALQDHPDRVSILKANPGLKVAAAREIMRDYRAAQAAALKSVEQSATPNPLHVAATATTDSVAGDDADRAAAEEDVADPADDDDESDADDPDWRVNETRRWAGMALRDAVTVFQLYGPETHKHLAPDRIRGIDEPQRLVDTLRDGGAAMTALADRIEAVVTAAQAA
jgi:hypothetical protein